VKLTGQRNRERRTFCKKVNKGKGRERKNKDKDGGGGKGEKSIVNIERDVAGEDRTIKQGNAIWDKSFEKMEEKVTPHVVSSQALS